jgi:iron complex outermembrane receptor protein
MLKFYLCILSFALVLFTFGQEKEIELDPITVTASLTPLSASRTGRNIIIIKGDLLTRMPVNSIDELIRFIPGVEVQSRGPMGTQSNITIRGGTFQQVLIILDGIRLNDPLTGHFNSYIPISPSEIDRIEILKGASSALYGSEAVGGVVHIITKTFARKKNKDGHKINAQFTAGEYGLTNVQAGGFFHKNKTSGSIGVLSNHANGQQLRGVKGYFDLTTFSASLKQELGKNWSVGYRLGIDNRDFNAQNFYTQFLSDTATENVKSTWHHLKTEYQKNKHHFSLDLGLKKTTDQYRFNKLSNPNINNSNLNQVLALYDYQINENSIITGGTQFINRKIISNDRGDHEVNSVGVFVILNQKAAKGLQINPAFRVDWNSRSGYEILPQLNVNYRYSDFLFRAGIGRTSRDADFTERFNNYNRTNVPSNSRIGNPDLSAETSLSYEFGVEYFLSSNIKIATTVFERYHKKLIDWVRTPYANIPRKDNLIPGGVYNLASNIDKVNTTGVETDIQYNYSFAQKHTLSGGIGTIWMQSLSSDTIPSLYVSNHAKGFLNFFMNYRYKVIGISINGLTKRRNTLKPVNGLVPLSASYFLLNMRVDANLAKDKCIIFLQADNLFNTSYSDILGSVMPSRWLMGGVKINL